MLFLFWLDGYELMGTSIAPNVSKTDKEMEELKEIFLNSKKEGTQDLSLSKVPLNWASKSEAKKINFEKTINHDLAIYSST